MFCNQSSSGFLSRRAAPFFAAALLTLPIGCNAGSGNGSAADNADSVAVADNEMPDALSVFSADSAFSLLKKQVDFGPRVPNTTSHRLAGDWIASQLALYCDTVITQSFSPRTFDGVKLNARNFFGQLNPKAHNRILLLAHWDCRPWADQDDDPAKHSLPVDGANDGASGVAVILEIARALKTTGSSLGVDCLFVDAEDWGSDNDSDSWALGAQHFADNPPIKNYNPDYAILLDMVGGKNASFPREYFSENNAPQVNDRIWQAAARLGFDNLFVNTPGGAVTDDHVQLIDAGIPAVDIIEYHPGKGFNPTWHTADDTVDNIDPKTLEAVGKTVILAIQ